MGWIEDFLEYTDGTPSPEIFRLWSGLTCLSGALERRVYAQTGRGHIYPNLFTLLVGPPASGKSQAITPVSMLWRSTSKFLPPTEQLHTAPDNVTKASLVDALSRARGQRLTRANGTFPGGLSEWHTLLIASPEFGVLLPKHDLEFISVLNHIYDNPLDYREERRSLEGRNPDIFCPQIVILAGTQPDYLAAILPEEAWGMGFTSRIIMVYASSSPAIDLFAESSKTRDALGLSLAKRIAGMAALEGSFSWEPNAREALATWYKAGLPPVPDHTKLTNYNGRRVLHIIKLCMIASASRTADLVITLGDFERARNWLLAAEALMPDVFRAMLSRSDAVIIQDLHYHVWRIWATVPPDKRTPIPEVALYDFLKHRVPAERISRIIEVAERSGVLKHFPGGGWVPRPKNEHAPEGKR